MENLVFNNPLTGQTEEIELLNPGNLIDLGQKIKSLRLQRDLTQETLAVQANVSRSTVIRIEEGTDTIRYSSMIDVFQFLRLAFFVEGIEYPTPTLHEISKLIASKRKEIGLSLRELEALSGVNYVTLFNIEKMGSTQNTSFEISFSKIMDVLRGLSNKACLIQQDEEPVLFDDIQAYNLKQTIDHPMYVSPYR